MCSKEDANRVVGDLQIYWFPQIPCKMFTYDVETVEQGVAMLDAFARYDLFLLEHDIRKDYANHGGLRVWDDNSDGAGNPGWTDWEEDVEDTDTDNISLQLVH